MTTTDLHTKYRPKTWDDFVGNEAAASSIRHAVSKGTCHAFLLHGPPGVGKTTAARLIARQLGVDPDSLGSYAEHDAAVNTGVDDARAIVERVGVRPLGGGEHRVVVLDEAHMLSRSAWSAFLKVVEEPPPGTWWVFCTTQPEKVPATIRSRCMDCPLKPIGDKELFSIIDGVVSREDLPCSESVADAIVAAADGSPRRALVMLAKVGRLADSAALEVLKSGQVDDDGPAEAVDLCRALMRRPGKGDWSRVAKLGADAARASSAETVRRVALAYFSKVALDPRQADLALAVLDAFAAPYPPDAGQEAWPVMLSLAGILRA